MQKKLNERWEATILIALLAKIGAGTIEIPIEIFDDIVESGAGVMCTTTEDLVICDLLTAEEIAAAQKQKDEFLN